MAPTQVGTVQNSKYCHVRVLNLVEDGVRLDVFLGGVLLAHDVPYKHKGPYVRMRVGTMSAAAFFAGTQFRFYTHRRIALEDEACTLVVSGSARTGTILMFEDVLQDRPRTVRLVNAAPAVHRATLSLPGRPLVTAAYGEATAYLLWPARCANLTLYALYANEDLRVHVPERILHTMGPHTVYLTGVFPAPPEALMFRDGPEY